MVVELFPIESSSRRVRGGGGTGMTSIEERMEVAM